MENGRAIPGIREAERVREILGQRERLVAFRERLIRMTQQPQGMSRIDAAAYSRVGSHIEERVSAVLLGVPRGPELGTGGEQYEDARCRHVVDEQMEELRRGGIDPVEVFDDEQQRPRRGVSQDDRAQSLESLLAPPLRTLQGRQVALGQWQ